MPQLKNGLTAKTPRTPRGKKPSSRSSRLRGGTSSLDPDASDVGFYLHGNRGLKSEMRQYQPRRTVEHGKGY